MIRLAILNSNYVSINRHAKKGTEIFDYILIRQLARQAKRYNLKITAFASGDSELPVKIESINYKSSLGDKDIGVKHHLASELALVAKALSMQDEFDIYHVNLGNGDIVLPFAQFITKPVLITMHGSFLEEKFTKKYLGMYKNLENFYFVSLSSVQRLPLPNINYIDTIPHGIDIKRDWKFDQKGGEQMLWAGRAIREKGINDLLSIVKKVKRPLELFPLLKEQSPDWIRKLSNGSHKPIVNFIVKKALSRRELAKQFQKSKVFLFPIQWEEPFGLVLIESLASGTPVIAYARGSVSEIIEDGVTGFIINPSQAESKGEFITKKYGVEGFVEAIERLYALSDEDYLKMRKACRARVEKDFTVQQMGKRYIETYKKVLADWNKRNR